MEFSDGESCSEPYRGVVWDIPDCADCVAQSVWSLAALTGGAMGPVSITVIGRVVTG